MSSAEAVAPPYLRAPLADYSAAPVKGLEAVLQTLELGRLQIRFRIKES